MRIPRSRPLIGMSVDALTALTCGSSRTGSTSDSHMRPILANSSSAALPSFGGLLGRVASTRIVNTPSC